jgi:hypothetical protein
VKAVDAGQVAGLLVLLGVVGVLAAIAGSGIEAGPVKFPSIPGSRQKPLALVSVVVIVGGVTWWAIQRQSGSAISGNSTAADTGAASGKLRVSLIPAKSAIHVGDNLLVSAEVYDSLGQQLGGGQCALTWSDPLNKWTATTRCVSTVSEPAVSRPGIHQIAVKAQGLGGLLATGTGSVAVNVRP